MNIRSPQMGDSQGLKATYPKEGGEGAVGITPLDLARLSPGEFLNDTIIDFYMKCAAAPPCVLEPAHL